MTPLPTVRLEMWLIVDVPLKLSEAVRVNVPVPDSERASAGKRQRRGPGYVLAVGVEVVILPLCEARNSPWCWSSPTGVRPAKLISGCVYQRTAGVQQERAAIERGGAPERVVVAAAAKDQFARAERVLHRQAAAGTDQRAGPAHRLTVGVDTVVFARNSWRSTRNSPRCCRWSPAACRRRGRSCRCRPAPVPEPGESVPPSSMTAPAKLFVPLSVDEPLPAVTKLRVVLVIVEAMVAEKPLPTVTVVPLGEGVDSVPPKERV